jgi:hypothetical protein
VISLKNEYDKLQFKKLAVCALAHKAEGSENGIAGSVHPNERSCSTQ